MFDFEGETRDNDPPSSPGRRIASASGRFLAMVLLAVIALAAAGFTVTWLAGALRG